MKYSIPSFLFVSLYIATGCIHFGTSFHVDFIYMSSFVCFSLVDPVCDFCFRVLL